MIEERAIEPILKSMIAVDTRNPPGKNYRRLVDIIKEQLEPIGCGIEEVKAPRSRVDELIKEVEGTEGERVNIIASLKRGSGRTMILNAHMDVVPPGAGWKTSPFKLTKKGGRWYGRGAADDKGPLAVLLLVLRELAEDRKWRGTLVLASTVDEEIGGYTGLAYLLDSDSIRGDYCIVGDGGIDNVTNAANGCLRFRATLRGHSVHSSMNWKGVNAIEKAGKLIESLRIHNLSLSKRRSKVPANPLTGVDRLTPSLTVGVVRGGTKVNVVPDKCVLEIDRRVIPDEKKSVALGEFKSILKKLRESDDEFDCELVVGGFHDSFITPSDSEIIKILSAAYEAVTTRKCRVLGCLGCLDAAHAAKKGIPVAAIGASRLESNVHGSNENVRVGDLVDFGEIVKGTVLKALS